MLEAETHVSCKRRMYEKSTFGTIRVYAQTALDVRSSGVLYKDFRTINMLASNVRV